MSIPIALIGGLLIIAALIAVVAIVWVLMRSDGGGPPERKQSGASSARPRQAGRQQQKASGQPSGQQTAIYNENTGETARPRPGQTAIDPFTVAADDLGEPEDDDAVQTDIDPQMLDDSVDVTLPDEAALADTQIEAPPREELIRRLQARQGDDVPESAFGYLLIAGSLHPLDEGETIIGSDTTSDLTLHSDPDIAEQHLRILAVHRNDDIAVFAEPLQNANDILHNRQPLTERVRLQPDDTLALSPQTTMIYTHSTQGE